jgi:hypothetical protein
MTRLVTLLVLAVTFASHVSASASAQPASRTRYTGRALADVLRELQREGLSIVFSSELVKADMRVTTEPTANESRGRVDDLLRPHGLATQTGPGGMLLVVRRLERSKEGPRAPNDPPAGTIRGVVVDADTGAPLAAVQVRLQQTTRVSMSDEDGAFALDAVPPGRQTLYVSLVGYALLRPGVDVRPSETTEMRIALPPGTSTYTETLTVRPGDGEAADDRVPAMRRLDNADIQQLRGVLTDDPARAVQALPGVTASDDYRSEFSVRAADFRHIGVSIDGIAVPWPLHEVRGREDTGSIAIINSDLLDHASLAPAAYPQRYGSRTGAWLDFGLREGSRDRVGAHGAVGATNASAVVEGPIADGRGAWIASIRRSYLDWLLRTLDYDSTTFGFFDHQSKLVFDLSARHQLQFSAVAGRSGMHETEIDPGPNSISDGDSHTALVTAGVRSVLGPIVLLQRASFVSQGFDNTGDFGQHLGSGSFRDLSYRADVTAQPWPRATLELGGEVHRARQFQAVFSYAFAQSPTVTALRSVSEFSGDSWLSAAHLHVSWQAFDRFGFSPGVRVAHSTLTGETLASPWLQGSWRVGRAIVRAGAGLYEQFPEFAHVLGTQGNADAVRERARHLDLAVEYKLSDRLRAAVALYHRDEDDLLRLENGEPRLVDDQLRAPVGARYENAVTGSPRGVEVTVERRDANGLSGWLSYAYGRARYEDRLTGESFWGDFDQRHAVSVYGRYRPSGHTSLSAKFRAGTNVPLAGYFEERDGGLYLSDHRNDTRLPRYARLDVRADRTFTFTKRRLTLFAELVNVLNRANMGPADGTVRFATREAVGFVEELFPLLPSAGLLLEF